jgi:hypothetical protein
MKWKRFVLLTDKQLYVHKTDLPHSAVSQMPIELKIQQPKYRGHLNVLCTEVCFILHGVLIVEHGAIVEC